MVKRNQNIGVITKKDFKSQDSFHLVGCIIDEIDLIGIFELEADIIVESCIINSFQIHSCWFVNGLLLKNCIVKNYIDYQMGGHNEKPIIIEGNIFVDFFNFFDCQFKETIEVRNNFFAQGTNLLGNKGEGFENTFEKGWLAENNKGALDINGV